MFYSQLGTSNLSISSLLLGTWVFGGDKIWWGKQKDLHSFRVMELAIENGVNIFDTAPIYGKGHSETIIGNFLKLKNLRDKVFLATKCGLKWTGKKFYHDLSPDSILEEFENSRIRLQTDIIDIYQIHYPDKKTPIKQTADTLNTLYEKGKIRAIGVSNFSIKQMKDFLQYAPIHSFQPPYNFFARHIEQKEIPFCLKNKIGIISYAPLQQGILTGKYHFQSIRPKGLNRRMNPDLNGTRFEITKTCLLELQKIAKKYNLSLTQLSINWVIQQTGITGAIVGARTEEQAKENFKLMKINISTTDIQTINYILNNRKKQLNELQND